MAKSLEGVGKESVNDSPGGRGWCTPPDLSGVEAYCTQFMQRRWNEFMAKWATEKDGFMSIERMIPWREDVDNNLEWVKFHVGKLAADDHQRHEEIGDPPVDVHLSRGRDAGVRWGGVQSIPIAQENQENVHGTPHSWPNPHHPPPPRVDRVASLPTAVEEVREHVFASDSPGNANQKWTENCSMGRWPPGSEQESSLGSREQTGNRGVVCGAGGDMWIGLSPAFCNGCKRIPKGGCWLRKPNWGAP